MAYVHEYKCGCIVHELAGNIRRCAGLTSRSLSGKMLPKGDSAEQKHNAAMGDSTEHVWEVANILP